MPDPLRGLIAATYTPFAADGSLSLEVIPRYAELLRSSEDETSSPAPEPSGTR